MTAGTMEPVRRQALLLLLGFAAPPALASEALAGDLEACLGATNPIGLVLDFQTSDISEDTNVLGGFPGDVATNFYAEAACVGALDWGTPSPDGGCPCGCGCRCSNPQFETVQQNGAMLRMRQVGRLYDGTGNPPQILDLIVKNTTFYMPWSSDQNGRTADQTFAQISLAADQEATFTYRLVANDFVCNSCVDSPGDCTCDPPAATIDYGAHAAPRLQPHSHRRPGDAPRPRLSQGSTCAFLILIPGRRSLTPPPWSPTSAKGSPRAALTWKRAMVATITTERSPTPACLCPKFCAMTRTRPRSTRQPTWTSKLVRSSAGPTASRSRR